MIIRKITFVLLLVFIFMIPWEDVYHFPGLGTAAKFVGFVLAASWVASVISTGRFRRPHLFHVIACLYVLWNALSIVWSADANRTVFHVITFAQLLVLTFIMWDMLTTRAALLIGLQMYVFGAWIAAGSTINNFFSGNAIYHERFSANGTNPDDLGAILVLGIPVAWYLATSGITGKIKTDHLLKLVNYAYVPAALMAVALSGTRTALIAAIPGMVFGIATLSRLRPWPRTMIFLLLVVGIAILVPLVPQASLQRLATVTEITGGDLNGREIIWRQGLESFADHPLIGVGSNMFRSVNDMPKRVGTPTGSSVASIGKVAHNSFISVLVEVGLVGFLLFGSMIAIAVIQALGQPKWTSAFWLSVLAVWSISAFSLTWEHRKPTWLFLSLVIVGTALSHRDEVESKAATFLAPLLPRATSGRFRPARTRGFAATVEDQST